MDREPGAPLWPRAAVVGTVAGCLGTVGHASAGGLLPGPAVLVAVLTVSIALSATALREQASARRLGGLLVLGQAWVHLALAVAAGHHGNPPGGPVGPGGTRHPVDQVVASPAHLEATTSGGSELLTHTVEHAPMMAAHALVAVLVALWLAWGERAWWTLLALSAGVLMALLRPQVPVALPDGGRAAPAPEPRSPVCRPGTATPLSRRGPPLLPEPLSTSCC